MGKQEKNEETETKNISIAFVFDTTFSMSDVLRQVRRHAYQILEHIEMVQNQHTIKSFNYVLLTFNDPVVDEPLITTNKHEFLQGLNHIRCFGGGDCPEPSLMALEKALMVTSKMSQIFLFTDADSKEQHITEALKDLIAKQKPSLYFIISGKCFDNYDPIYKHLAHISGGQYFNINQHKVGSLLSKLEHNLHPDTEKIIETRSLDLLITPLKLDFSNNPLFPVQDDNVTLNCTLLYMSHNIPSVVKLSIYFNANIINESIVNQSITNSLVYNINSITDVNNGEYQCTVSNHKNETSIVLSEQKISLKGKPKIYINKKNYFLFMPF